MRTIDADALKEDLTRFYDGEVTARNLIDEQPTIGGWISNFDGQPEQHESCFAHWYGTKKWRKEMWKEESDKVIVAIKFPSGLRETTTGRLFDGKWKIDAPSSLNPIVTVWIPMPKPPYGGDA